VNSIWFLTHVQEQEHGTLRLGGPASQGHRQGIHPPDIDGLSLAVTAAGGKSWHFRYYWLGKQKRMSLGTYPEVSFARRVPCAMKRARWWPRTSIHTGTASRSAPRSSWPGENTFEAVYKKWLAHRELSLKKGRQTTLSILPRVFAKDVLPLPGQALDLRHQAARSAGSDRQDRAAQGAVRRRESQHLVQPDCSATRSVVVPGLEQNPASDLDVVALPLPPVNHNPFLRMAELPKLLQRLRKYRGRLQTQLGLRLLLLTGVRTGELRLATPDQFDLDRGLWIIPPEVVKQLQVDMRKEAQLAQGHSTLHRAAVGAGHGNRPAHAGTAQAGPALPVPPRQ
jgi:hypothetical protein